MSKLSDLESTERRNIEEELEAKAAGMGMDCYDSYDSNTYQSYLKDAVGICHNCKNLHYCRAEFAGHDKVFAKCNLFDMKLSGQNRITECNCHNARKILSLTEMYAIATLIEVDKDEIKGFVSLDPKLRKNK